VAEKFKEQVQNYKKQQKEPETVRGLSIKELAVENLHKVKQEKEQMQNIRHYVLYGLLAIYALFFTFLYKIVGIFKDVLLESGIFTQLILVVLGIIGINRFLAFMVPAMPDKKRQNILSMLQIYGYICILIAFVAVNGLPFDWFKLTP
jgi:hypothetical protein